MKRIPLAGLFCAGFWLVTLSMASAGSSIGLNFGGDISQLFSEDSCGVAPQKNWCNLSGASGSQEGLMDAQGNKTTAKVVWSSAMTTGKTAPDAEPLERLLKGYLDGGSHGEPATVTISDIPYQHYTVYVYFAESDKVRTTSTYSVNGAETMIIPGTSKDGLIVAQPIFEKEVDAEKRGTYMEFTDQTGNFEIVTGDSKGWQNDASGDFRSPINAIQIVESEK